MSSKTTLENENPGNIEKMTEADIETIMEIERKSFEDPWKLKKVL